MTGTVIFPCLHHHLHEIAMATSIVYLIFLLIRDSLVTSQKVLIAGPRYVEKNSTIQIACESDIVPIGLSAEFFVNGKAFASIHHFKDECYDGSVICKSCECSNDGKSYRILYKDTTVLRSLNFTCSMTFNINGLLEVEDSYFAELINVEGPFIHSASNFPLYSGSNTHLNCSVKTTLQHYSLAFDCMNKTTYKQNISTSESHVEMLSLAKESYNSSYCQCKLEWNGFVKVKDLRLHIKKYPILQMTNNVSCVSSALLSCSIKGNFPSYGFVDWVHTLKGKFIRYIKPNAEPKMTTIEIQPCLHTNAGEYTCVAWTKDKENVTFTNRTTELYVEGPPEIVKTLVNYGNHTTLSALVYSSVAVIKTQWTTKIAVLLNTTYSIQTVRKRYKKLQIYGVAIDFLLYEVNLTMTEPAFNNYILLVKNEYGVTEYIFQLKNKNADFQKHVILWVLLLTCIIVISSSAVAIMSRKQRTGSFEGAAMYHGVNRGNSNVNPYDHYSVIHTENYYLEVVNDGDKSLSDQEGLFETPQYEEIQ